MPTVTGYAIKPTLLIVGATLGFGCRKTRYKLRTPSGRQVPVTLSGVRTFFKLEVPA